VFLSNAGEMMTLDYLTQLVAAHVAPVRAHTPTPHDARGMPSSTRPLQSSSSPLQPAAISDAGVPGVQLVALHEVPVR